jgi:toluene monooxygenase system protein A
MIDPPTPPGVIAYMGITPDVSGDDAAGYAWAHEGAREPAGVA